MKFKKKLLPFSKLHLDAAGAEYGLRLILNIEQYEYVAATDVTDSGIQVKYTHGFTKLGVIWNHNTPARANLLQKKLTNKLTLSDSILPYLRCIILNRYHIILSL